MKKSCNFKTNIVLQNDISFLPHCLKKCPDTEFFLVRIFLYFGLDTEKYGPEKTPYLDTVQVVSFIQKYGFRGGFLFFLLDLV